MSDIVSTHRLTEAASLRMIQAGVAKANELGCKVSLAVVDQSCRLIAFLMMDGARHFSIITTQRKAITSASQRMPTGYAPEENAISMTVRMGDFTNVPGGFPITAMLATSDEVAAGRVGHALRFILPNDRIRDGIYVPPGTHSTGPTSGGPATPPYGVRFRLKASFDTSSMSSGGKVLAQALKTYGMFLADGGQIAVTIASDRFSTAKWSALGVTNNRSLASITVNDFEVVDYGTEVDYKADDSCHRNP